MSLLAEGIIVDHSYFNKHQVNEEQDLFKVMTMTMKFNDNKMIMKMKKQNTVKRIVIDPPYF